MSVDKSTDELGHWVSTYGLITAERILEKYSIHFTRDELKKILQDPDDFYHKILKNPLKNVMNGIVLQQAHDYQLYLQKLLIDYLMLDEGSVQDESNLQMTLEEERQRLIDLGTGFHQKEIDHANLIATSQNTLKKIISNLNGAKTPQFTPEIEEILILDKEKIDEMSVVLNTFRTQFYELLLRVLELIKLLPNYRIDPIQDLINREPLYFDKSIGEI